MQLKRAQNRLGIEYAWRFFYARGFFEVLRFARQMLFGACLGSLRSSCIVDKRV
jgi:hypothetical protein